MLGARMLRSVMREATEELDFLIALSSRHVARTMAGEHTGSQALKAQVEAHTRADRLDIATSERPTVPDEAPHRPISAPDPEAYLAAFREGRQVELPRDSTLRGRILRGREEADFEVLGSAERSVCFIMGPDGLSMLPGIEPFTALDRIGLSPHYVQGRMAQGHRFRLLVFDGGHAAPQATWDNALDLISETRPELADDIARHRNALRTTPFEVFQADVVERMEDIELAGTAHPDYMSLEKYRALSPDERADPAKLRRLLFHIEHLGDLFSGDGYTRTPDGERGLAEYLVPNGRIADLPGATMIDLV